MRHSLFSRIFAGALLLLTAFAGVALWLAFSTIQLRYNALLAQHLHGLACAVGTGLLSGAGHAPGHVLQTNITAVGRATGVRMTIIATNGAVVADSSADARVMDNHASLPEVRAALAGHPALARRFSDTARVRHLYAAVPVVRDGQVIAVARASAPLHSLAQLLHLARRELAMLLAVVILLAVGAAAFLAHCLARPVRELSAAAHAIAAGNFDTLLDLTGTREFEELSSAFNQMTRHVRDVVAQLTSRNAELDAVISAMREALVVLDEHDHIVLANTSFARLSLVPPSRQTHVWECIRVPALADMVQATRTSGTRASGDVQINDKHFLCNVTPLNGSREIVVTLHDVTELKRVERMRRDFVSNVSHELRTPLTAIKGFVETLEEDAALHHNRYLEIIRRHTDRLIAIVQDLLTLSSLEQRIELQREPTDLHALASNVVKIFEPRLRAKNLACVVAADPNLPPVSLDRFRFDQVLVNLIDNAIKYTEQGGITIRIRRADDRVRINIEDTGVGIPPEHLERIFERFYTVDKSRARKYGGTGLGLSIVKHIIMLHGGTISVASEVNHGTTFTIELPLTPPSTA